MRTWLALPLLAGALVVVAGCAELGGASYGSLELTRPLGVATVPFEISASRAIAYGCDTESKINPCRSGSEVLQIVSVTCDASDCVVAPAPPSQVRVVAARPGRYIVDVEARGTESGENVSADTAVDVLAAADVEVEIELELGPLYTALGEVGSAVPSAKLVARDGRTVSFDPTALTWSASDASVVPWERTGQHATVKIAGAQAGPIVVSAAFSPSVFGETRLDVRSASDAVRTVVAVAESELDPDAIDATASAYGVYTPIELHAAHEDAARALYAARADALRVEGAGCTLSTFPARAGAIVDTDVTARSLDVAIGARCTLIVGADPGARRIPVKRDAPHPPGA